ncbi:unnamed protein product [Closterium sp. NIES-53]
MYAVSTSDEGDCYLCLPPDPGGGAAALGACEIAALGASASAAPGAGESALSGTASAQVFHTFTLDSGASRSFFLDRTTLTPLRRPVAVSLADPSGGPVLASFSTVLPCPAAPSGSLSGLFLPSFSTNLVTASRQVFAAASGSGHESAPCSCRLLSHQTLLWHHRLGHPSLPRLRGMACQKAPLQTLHMDVWGPARVRGQGHERYFLLVVDDYSHYTTVFPLRSKGDVTEVLIDWIRADRLQLRESFGSDFPVLRLHSRLGQLGVAAEKPASPVARETVAPVACEPVGPVAREPVAPVARESVARLPLLLAAEPVTPVARVPVAPVARVPVAPVARVPVAPVAPCASSFSCRPLSPLLS